MDFVFSGFRVKPLSASATAWVNAAPLYSRVGFTQFAPTAAVTGVSHGPTTELGPALGVTITRRPAHGPLASPQHLADRLNIFGPEQLRGYAAVVDGVLKGAAVSGSHDYSQGLSQRAMARTTSTPPRWLSGSVFSPVSSGGRT